MTSQKGLKASLFATNQLSSPFLWTKLSSLLFCFDQTYRSANSVCPGGSRWKRVRDRGIITNRYKQSSRLSRPIPLLCLSTIQAVMLPSLVRRQFTGLIPPKIATPSHLVCLHYRAFPSPLIFYCIPVCRFGRRTRTIGELLLQAPKRPCTSSSV
jgi:hypothetical protein